MIRIYSNDSNYVIMNMILTPRADGDLLADPRVDPTLCAGVLAHKVDSNVRFCLYSFQGVQGLPGLPGPRGKPGLQVRFSFYFGEF